MNDLPKTWQETLEREDENASPELGRGDRIAMWILDSWESGVNWICGHVPDLLFTAVLLGVAAVLWWRM
jgi:hypothetical protein